MKRYLDAFYGFMDRIGYMHPIHPAMVHMPIGLVAGATVFIGIAAFARFHQFRVSAHHVLMLALIFWFPTVLFGILDWQRYLGGAWLFVIKMKLAHSLQRCWYFSSPALFWVIGARRHSRSWC
jgi:hypothetical protein